MPPPPPPSTTACEISQTPHDGHAGPMDILDLPIFDDSLIWAPPKPTGALPHHAPAPLPPFAQPGLASASASASRRDLLPGLEFGRNGHVVEHAQDRPTDPSTQLENALLLFSKPTFAMALLDEARQPVQLDMTAELGGMFFVAEDIFSDHPTEQPGLTCYRRNLWQCLGDITFSSHPKYLLDEHGNELVISQLMASLVANESISGNTTDIVSTSWKTTDPITGNALWAMNSPQICPLNIPHAPYRDGGGPASVKIAWKRLQFKHATANNGRRKGPQQHYTVQIHLLAESDVGNCLKIAEIQSSPVIVRGRSPRNFDNQKEVPAARAQKPDKRAFLDVTTPLDDTGLDASYAHPSSQHRDPNQQASRRPRTQSTSWPPRKRLATSPESPRSSLHWFARSPESVSNTVVTSALDSASEVLGLSLFDGEVDPRESERESPVPSEPTAPGSSVDLEDDDDLFYQYFPLSAEDWMESIEAVYCPHANHYANPYRNMQKLQEEGRPRRYFTART